MRTGWLGIALLAMCSMPGFAAAEEKNDSWAAFRFLMGEWVGEGDGTPGKGSGGYSFATELDGKVLVRKSTNNIPASNGRPAVKHEDLMIIYKSTDGKRYKAMYFDNEDHVIEYAVTAADDGKSITFVSDANPSSPRFRLTYSKGKQESVGIKFEIASPGKPDAFKTYLEGSAKRKAGREKGKS